MILPLRFFDFLDIFLRLPQFLDLVVIFGLLGSKEGSGPHYDLWYPQEKRKKSKNLRGNIIFYCSYVHKKYF